MIENVARTVVHCMSNFGIGYMAGEVAMALTPQNANKVVKACIYVGSVAAGGAIAVKADAYIDNVWDSTKELIKSLKVDKKNKKTEKEEDPIETVVMIEEESVEDALEKVKKEIEEAKKNDPMKKEVEKLKKKTQKRLDELKN